MPRFLEFQDALTLNKYGKDDLPFYAIISRLTTNYRLHYHNAAELSLVIEGNGVEKLNGKSHALRRGTVSFLLPNHMHEIVIAPGTALSKYCCMFDLNLVLSDSCDPIVRQHILQIGSELPSHYDLSGEQLDAFSRLMEDMFQEYNADRLGKNTVIRARLAEACVFLLRTAPGEGPSDPGTRHDKPGIVMDMLKYMHQHYNEPLSLTALSETMGRNASYLSSVFKRHVGQSFVEYMHSLRIGRAAGLLSATTMSVSEVALEVGFDTFRTFSKVFKEIKGVTPQQFRRQAERKHAR
ncbi:AraC family transcriptional regulator [Paenibacillus solanacearum]|uniref:AraC family transcriptional regulator n=1 Tax=Paenibacillus solanacearum TaxID=2048548 RepID=UPI001C4031FF|nr:AraC family transcriptional regulator [Paenibacillus solanacearum]